MKTYWIDVTATITKTNQITVEHSWVLIDCICIYIRSLKSVIYRKTFPLRLIIKIKYFLIYLMPLLQKVTSKVLNIEFNVFYL